ncbi:MAG: 2-C-methyl-D-erythritol 4-phosphate cytidylyltransferase [Balneola sp.]|nr:MAG: 2-C-methyl-D-erythritol 4-phosphate cytidylyltransferase [Balneola sp.]
MTKLAVIIPAAGSGSRLGSRIPKPFIELEGSTILEHTIRAFLNVPSLSEIVIPTSKESVGRVEDIFKSLDREDLKMMVVEGGSERQYSIHNALKCVSDEIDLVAVHDAVRPFISANLIEACCEKAVGVGASIIAVPAKDTIKRINEAYLIDGTPDRKFLWQAQTPQIFKKEIILEAYESARSNGFIGTDDSSLVEQLGYEVGVVEGDRRNLKITYPIDLKIAELILKEEI